MKTCVNRLGEDTKRYFQEMTVIFGAGEKLVGPSYLSICPKLPTADPIDHPHLLDKAKFTEYTFTRNPRLCDGVATVLWNFDQEAFTKFFDKNVNNFAWLNKAWPWSFYIFREGSEVTAAMCYLQEDFMDWEWLIKSKIDFVNGKWTDIVAGSGRTPLAMAGRNFMASYPRDGS